jgi:hypothetical protein
MAEDHPTDGTVIPSDASTVISTLTISMAMDDEQKVIMAEYEAADGTMISIAPTEPSLSMSVTMDDQQDDMDDQQDDMSIAEVTIPSENVTSTPQKVPNMKQSAPVLKCSTCSYKCTKKYNLQRHCLKHTNDKKKCGTCSLEFYDMHDLNVHIMTTHSTDAAAGLMSIFVISRRKVPRSFHGTWQSCSFFNRNRSFFNRNIFFFHD